MKQTIYNKNWGLASQEQKLSDCKCCLNTSTIRVSGTNIRICLLRANRSYDILSIISYFQRFFSNCRVEIEFPIIIGFLLFHVKVAANVMYKNALFFVILLYSHNFILFNISVINNIILALLLLCNICVIKFWCFFLLCFQLFLFNMSCHFVPNKFKFKHFQYTFFPKNALIS